MIEFQEWRPPALNLISRLERQGAVSLPGKEFAMRFYDNALLHAASDLNAFLGCAHAAALNLQKLRDPQSLPDKAEDDESMVLVQDAGHAHEAAYLARLVVSGNVVEISSKGDLRARARATAE